MNRKQADVVAGVVISGILAVGVLTAVQLFVMDDPMGGDVGSAPVMRSVGPVLMSLVVASIVGGVYVYVRDRLFTPGADSEVQTGDGTEPGTVTGADDAPDGSTAETADAESADPPVQRRILDVLPEDEHRILEPVLESPGLTQIEVRDRSGFSKSKVSQTITDLEERGLLFREPQGRTYRVYPADDLDERI